MEILIKIFLFIASVACFVAAASGSKIFFNGTYQISARQRTRVIFLFLFGLYFGIQVFL